MKVTRYPVILVHGIILKDGHFFKSFGNIERSLKKNGYAVFTAPTDGFGTIENNAAQLKAYVEKILGEEHAEKVNLIAHSKGGLDSICMIKQYGMEDKVASLTTISTPHLGSPIASYILNCPEWILKIIASNIDLCYSILGDINPNSLEVCKQLKQRDKAEFIDFSEKVYCQSYSSICMIKQYGMEDKVASLTTISTPHLGSPIASYILNCPEWILKIIASNIDLCYSILGDINPNSLEVCKQLKQRDKAEFIDFSEKVYCQSYSTTLKSEDDDIIMGIPYYFSKQLEKKDTDGLVSVDSSKFENYRGNCEEDSISHSEIVGLTINQGKKERIVRFYLQMLSELAEMGF